MTKKKQAKKVRPTKKKRIVKKGIKKAKRKKKKTAPKKTKSKTQDELKALPNLIPENLKAFQLDDRRGGRKSKLQTVLEYNPDLYKRMLSLIQLGCYMHVVAAAMGVDYATFGNWLRSGKVDSAEEKDTIYSRFFADVYKATAQARLNMELQLLDIVELKKDPGLLRHWLAKGPGQLLGKEWQEKHVLDVTLDSPPEIEQDEEEYLDVNSAPVDVDTMAGALTALEDLGLLQRTERSGDMFLKDNREKDKPNG